uniref:Integrase catalytic domain-containing protein n=1 Tax=Fagus sylvatica TaxID=28930 RepID=A0A2N9HZZ8_FAGSY
MISVFPESLSKQAAAWFYQLRNLTGWDDLVRVFLERYRFNPHSILEYLGLKKDEEPYIIPDPGVSKVIVEIKEGSDMSSLPALAEGEEEEKDKPPPPAKEPDSITSAGEGEEPIKTPPSSIIITTTAEEEYAGPMVEGLSIHTITEEEDSTTTPPARRCQQGEEVKTWTCVPLLQRVSSSNEVKSREKSRLEPAAPPEQKEALIALLREFHEIFAWSYQDMPGLDTDIVVHKIPLKPECKPVKQALRRMKPEVILKIKEEVEKQVEGRFPKHSNLFGLGSQYSPGAEKGRKTTNAVFSFMDGFSGYNQIKMAEEDKSKTAFVTHWGTFVYDVMPFGLKNAGATYQRAMVTLFHDMIHHEIEVYVDDMIAKSRTAQDHLTDLRKLFQRLKKYQLRLNPNKCAFGVTSGKLLGFIVSGRGIEIRSRKARFIAQLTATCEPLFKLLRKDVKIKWTEDCQKAFDKIKEYLLNPPILVPPTPGRPLILYLTVQEASMGCMLGQQDETGKKEQAIYYLSKKFTEPETRYLLVEKTCCALAWASKKLRQYMLYYTTWLVSRNGPDQAIKGQAIADYLADYPSEQLELMDSEFPDEDVMTVDEDNHGRWKLYFDGAANAVGSGIGAVLVSPKGQQTPIALTITFADALATLASLIKLVEGDDVRPLRIETRDIPAYCVCVEECMNVEAEIDDKPWYYDIKRFIQDREYPPRATENEKKYIRRMAFQFFLSGEILYKRTHDATLLRCVDAEEANRLIQGDARGTNGSPCQRTLPGPEDHESWLLLVDNGEGLHQTCPDVPQMPDVSEQQERTSPISSHYGLAVAVLSLGNGCDRFVKNNIICRYGMPEMLITDNASNLNNRMMDQLCQQFKIQHHNSAPYRPKMNGAVEAANKNVKKILSKMTETYKDWHEHLPYALCAYRTSVRTSVGATPYSLVYGMEAVLPVEVEIPSLRILSQTQLEEAEWAQARYEQLNFIDEKRLAALCHGQLYQRTDRKSLQQEGSTSHFPTRRSRSEEEEYGPYQIHEGKFAPSYEGPYVVKKAFSGGAIILADMDGEEFRSPINSDSVIKYHV